jgi:hypothetical protein
MLAFPPSLRVFLASEPVDMRRGHDGLFAIVKSWKLDPFIRSSAPASRTTSSQRRTSPTCSRAFATA